MIGFDNEIAGRAARRRGALLAAALAFVVSVPLLVQRVRADPAGWGIGPPGPETVAVFALTVLVFAAANAGLARAYVAHARALHLYGRRARARVTVRTGEPLALFGTFWAEVEDAGGTGWTRTRCLGMPWTVRRLRVGQELLLVVVDRPETGRPPSAWLPYWLTPGGGSTDEEARPVLDGLATVSRPLEAAAGHRSAEVLSSAALVLSLVALLIQFPGPVHQSLLV
jgi:hypothetical protein